MSNSNTNALAIPQESLLVARPPMDFGKPIRVGLAAIVVTFGGFGLWAASAPLDSAVVAQGVLGVESKKKTLQHLEGGIVQEILVKDGDAVTAGQVMMRFEPTRALASLATVQSQLDAARAIEARLTAERDGADKVVFPEDLLARRDEPKLRDIMAMQEKEFAERQKTQVGQISLIDKKVGQLQAEGKGYRSQENSKNRQVELLRSELSGLYKLAQQGWYPKNKLREKERELAELEGGQGASVANQARLSLSADEAEIEKLQVRQKFREDATARLRDAQNQVNELHQRVVSAEDIVRRLNVVAPANGVVQGVRLATVGAVVPPGGELMDIVPLGDRLVIEAQVSPRDVEVVRDGQTAEVRFTALHDKATPVVFGRVVHVSADRFVDRMDRNLAYYTAKVEVSPEEQAKLGDHRLQPGMPVDLMLKVGERTALQYLLGPLGDAFARAMRER